MLVAGLTARVVAVAAVVALAAGIGIGFAIDSWQSGGIGDWIGGAPGALAGALRAPAILRGALPRGGPAGGPAAPLSRAAPLAAGGPFLPPRGYLHGPPAPPAA